MRMYDVILKKRRGEELSKEEIDFFIQGFTRGEIPDYQASALLMSIFFNSMNKRETADFTMSMVHSGETLNLDKIQGIKVDKHSTGGVGDTTTILLAPMVASCGVPVAKMSGRGLGHTGGTIDKLESFKGFSVELSEEKFMENVNDIGKELVREFEDDNMLDELESHMDLKKNQILALFDGIDKNPFMLKRLGTYLSNTLEF